MSQADTSFDCISNLTEIAWLAYSPSTNALVNKTCMDIMESGNACSSQILDDSDMPTQAQSPNEIVSEPRERVIQTSHKQRRAEADNCSETNCKANGPNNHG